MPHELTALLKISAHAIDFGTTEDYTYLKQQIEQREQKEKNAQTNLVTQKLKQYKTPALVLTGLGAGFYLKNIVSGIKTLYKR